MEAEVLTPDLAPSQPATMTAAELGRRGAAKRWASPEQRKRQGDILRENVKNNRQARMLAIMDEMAEAGVLPFASKEKRCADPEQYISDIWARTIPREWEQLLDAAKVCRDWDLVQRVLVAMTAMTPALSPLKLRQIAQSAANDLPGDMADLSAADDEMLAKLTGKRVGSRTNTTEAVVPRRRGRKRDGGQREPVESGPDLASGHHTEKLEPDQPTKKISSKSKKKAKRK